MEPHDTLKLKVDIVKAYCETAKSFVQLSTGALVLPLLFMQALFGKNTTLADASHRIPVTLKLGWACFLVSIGCGVLYQWLAVRLIWDELHAANRTPENANNPGYRTSRFLPSLSGFNRSRLYGTMVICFLAGAFCFVLFVAEKI